MRDNDPLKLAVSVQKSRAYFRHARWQGKRRCPRCGCRYVYHLNDGRYGCGRCRYNFGEFTGTYLGKVYTPPDTAMRLLFLFVLGVPAYRIRFYVTISLRSIERTFRIFREAIYDASFDELKELKLPGRLEMDEALFGGHGHGKRGWGAKGRHSYSAHTRETAEL